MATDLDRDTLESFRVGSLPTVFYIPDYISSQEQLRLLQQVNAAPVSKWKALKNRRLQNWGGVVHEKGLLPQALPPWLSALTEKIDRDLGLFPSPINHVLVNEYLPGQGIMPHQDGPAYFPVVAILSLGSPALMQFTPHPWMVSPIDTSLTFSSEHFEGKAVLPLQPHAKAISLLLMPGSLLIFKDSAYQDYLHGIDECFEHNLDETVVNLEKAQLNRVNEEGSESLHVASTEHADRSGPTKEDPYNIGCISSSLKRNGTRISLTCRLVTRVHRNLIRL